MTLIVRRKRRAALILSFLLLAAWSVLAQQNAAKQEERIVRVTLLQVNDVYRFTPADRGTRGGLARVSTLRKQIMEKSPNTLFLLSGDTISPSVESLTYKGAQMIDAWNAIGLDYSVFGNHEFDFGPEVLKERMKESHFGWLGANVIDKKTGKTFADTPPYVVREFEGVKIGIIGLVLPETKTTSRPGPDVEFLSPCDVARVLVPEMRSRGVNIVVGLTHLTMREDKELARCADFDVIIGGHEHTLLESLSIRTPIFKMTSDAREMARIQLNIYAGSGKLESIDWEAIPVTNAIADDPAFSPVTRKYEKLLRELDERVGRTDVPLEARDEPSRSEETNIGDFISDAFRRVTGADVAILNGGSIRADTVIEAGDLTRRDVLSILPFPNPVVKLEVTGATIRAALEHGVSRSREDAQPGRFPQVSGLRFTFDASRPAGSRVTEVTVAGQPLDDRKTYTLATTTFLAVEGGDDYKMLQNKRFLIKPEQAERAPEVLRKAIASVKSIAPRTDGRIKRLDKKKSDE
ncbi:MAG: bifunctional metallophosphatase/5'-nucleotidase [Pyrinomonadaceae bacterium]|nr:bifunctional metallophosphatase/5'-nucleotidase [Pyrinomonadaceae bacterium]